MMTKRSTRSKKQDAVEARIRFNWGFHRGGEAREYLYAHFDAVYLAGFQAGFAVRSTYTINTLSDQAWQEYKQQR
jgi:hypothetical protein